MDDKYDSALLGILQHEGKVEKFLNTIFAFLYRRTDFYRIMKSKEDKLGFPPGMAVKMLTTIFKQYDDLTRRDDQYRLEAEHRRQQAKATDAGDQVKASQKTEATKEQSKPADDNPAIECSKGEGDNKIDPCGSVETGATANLASGESTSNRSCDGGAQAASKKPTAESKTQASEAGEGSEDPELIKQQQVFQNNPESYNGAERDNYSWSQSIADVDIRVKVPSHIRKGRDVKVDVGKKHVKVTHKDEQGQWKVVFDGDLIWEIQKEESMWTLNPGENVHINFEKKEERWWDSVLVDEPKINVRKIDASRPMTDLDDEAQAKIEEMMYNDRQKKMGLPTHQEQKMQDMLKNAWDAEGSPFKGQPFDPSKFTMDPSGTINMKPS